MSLRCSLDNVKNETKQLNSKEKKTHLQDKNRLRLRIANLLIQHGNEFSQRSRPSNRALEKQKTTTIINNQTNELQIEIKKKPTKQNKTKIYKTTTTTTTTATTTTTTTTHTHTHNKNYIRMSSHLVWNVQVNGEESD
jgi:hypothetical protein